MSRYRKVLSKIWSDEKFRALSADGQLLFLYHLTSDRATPFLLYVEGPGAIGDALRMGPARLAKAMKEVSDKGMARYGDDGSNLVFLPNALKLPENGPESPHALKTWLALIFDLPRTPFFFRCLDHWLSLSEGHQPPLDPFLPRCIAGRIASRVCERGHGRTTPAHARPTGTGAGTGAEFPP